MGMVLEIVQATQVSVLRPRTLHAHNPRLGQPSAFMTAIGAAAEAACGEHAPAHT